MELVFKGKFSKIFISKEIIIKQIDSDRKFENERSIHSLLNHENIVSFLGFNLEKREIYLEYCLEGTLKNCLETINIEQSFLQICAGLSYIHSKNIIHRDIKPENILIKNGVIKISDFGLSTVKQHPYIKSGKVGTIHYYSPEILKNQYYNEKTDIWSLGCVLYYMIYQRNLFNAETKEEIIEKICNADFYLHRGKFYNVLKNMLFTNKFYRLSIEDVIENFCGKKIYKDEDYLAEQNDIYIENGIEDDLTIKTDEDVNPYIGDMLIFQNKFYGQIVNVIDNSEEFKFEIEVDSLESLI